MGRLEHSLLNEDLSNERLLLTVQSEIQNSVNIDSWYSQDLDDDEVSDMSDEKTTTTNYSSEDVFYAQLNGDDLGIVAQDDPYDKMPLSHQPPDDEEEFAHDFKFNNRLALRSNSLFNFDLSEELKQELESEASKKSSMEVLPEMPEAESTIATESLRSDSNVEEEENEKLIDDLQDFLLNNLPDELKSKMPDGAWEHILTNSVINALNNQNHSTSPSQACAKANLSSPRKPSPFCGGENEHQSIPTVTREKKRPNRNISFDHVNVRCYEQILEVNPAVKSGPAIGIGWRYIQGGRFSVDEWERDRTSFIRASKDLVIPCHAREAMLKDLGYSQKEIAGSTRRILKVKHQRRTTVQNLGQTWIPNGVEEKMGTAVRVVKGLVLNKILRQKKKNKRDSTKNDYRGANVQTSLQPQLVPAVTA